MRYTIQVFGKRLWWLIAKSDTTPTRFMLAMTSSFWALLLLLPGESMSRPGFVYMAALMGENAEAKWTALWAICAVCLWWRLFASSQHRIVSQLINAYSCMLFTVACLAIFASRPYPIPAGIASDIACMLAAAWVLVRTHINSGPGWRHD